MRIGMLAPIAWRVPPRQYGPWERVVSILCEGLVRRGVEVTLFASADSETSARLVGTVPRPLAEDPTLDAKVWEALHLATVFERAAEFDLIHNHFDFMPLSYSGLVRTPLLTTVHGFSSPAILPVYQRYDRRTAYVSISDADRDPSLHYLRTIHHGVPLDDLPLGVGGADLVFLGRIHPDKGVLEAIEVARLAGRRLVIAGLIHDEAYWHELVAPHVDGDRVCYEGVVGPVRRAELLGTSHALLHLVNFAEPFGLSMIEAMACGTPVIARRRGSVPEVVDDGVTGFVIEHLDEALHAVGKVAALDRVAVRTRMTERFGAERMVDDYLAAYQQVIEGTWTASASA